MDHLTLAGGEVAAYGRLLLATGAHPRKVNLPGGGAEGIHYLRTLEDSEGLQAVRWRVGASWSCSSAPDGSG